MNESITLEINGSGGSQVAGEFNEIERAANGAKGSLEGFGTLRGLDSFIGDLRQSRGELDHLRSGLEGVSSFGMKMAGAGAASLAGLAAGVKATLDSYGDLQKVEGGFETMLGSPAAAKAKIKEIQDFAANSPYDFMGGAKGAQGLLAVGIAAADLVPIMKAVGNATAAAGGDDETFQGLLTTIQQTKSEGKLTKENLNQITGRGIGVQFLADKLGLTAEQLANVGEEGIDADRAIKALVEGFSEVGGGKAMEKQMETIPGQVSSLGDAFTQLKATVGEVFGEDASHLIQGLTGVLDKTKEFIAQHPDLVKTIATIGGIGGLGLTLGGGALMIGGSMARGAMDMSDLYKRFKNRKRDKEDDDDEEEEEEEELKPKKKKAKPAQEEEAEEEEGGDSPGSVSELAAGMAGEKAGDLAGGAAKTVASKFLGNELGEQVGDAVGGMAGDKVSDLVGGATDSALGKAGDVIGNFFKRKKGGGSHDDDSKKEADGLDATARSAEKAADAKDDLVRSTNLDIAAERQKASVAADESQALDEVADSALDAAAAKNSLASSTGTATQQMSLLARAQATLGKTAFSLPSYGTGPLGSALHSMGVRAGVRTVGQVGAGLAVGAASGLAVGDSLSDGASALGISQGTATAAGLGTGLAVSALTILAPQAILPVAAATAIGEAIKFAADKLYIEPKEKEALTGSGAEDKEKFGDDMQSKLDEATKAAKSGTQEGYTQLAEVYAEMSSKAGLAGDAESQESYAAAAGVQRALARKAGQPGTAEYDIAQYTASVNSTSEDDKEGKIARFKEARMREGASAVYPSNGVWRDPELERQQAERERQFGGKANSYQQAQYAAAVQAQTQGDVKVEVKVTRGETKYERDAQQYDQTRRRS